MTRVGLTWADDEGQGDTREDVLFNSNDEWIKEEERRGGSPRAIAAEPGTHCVPPAPSLFWKQTAVRGFSPRRSFISLTATTSRSCVVNTHQRGGLLLTKQTEEEFHFDGDLYGERQAAVRSAPRNIFVTSEVDDEARKQRALINLHSNTVCLVFFFLSSYFMCTHVRGNSKQLVKWSRYSKCNGGHFTATVWMECRQDHHVSQ